MAENIKTRSWNRFYDFFIISVLFILSMLIRIYNYFIHPMRILSSLIIGRGLRNSWVLILHYCLIYWQSLRISLKGVWMCSG
jgi:hypothetical protein